MSLPLSRRIVQAAFVVAAGAVPAMMTGVASAAPALPAVPDLGGLSQLDAGALGGNVQSAAHQAGQVTGSSASSAVDSAVPALADATGGAAAKALPEANRMLGSTAGQLAQMAGSTAGTTGSLAGAASNTTRAMPVDGVLPATGSATGTVNSVAPQATAPLAAAPAAPTADVPTSSTPAGPLSTLPLNGLPAVNSLPLGSAQSTLSGVTGGAAPSQRLGGLPGLGSSSGLGDVSQTLPLSSLPVLGGLPTTS